MFSRPIFCGSSRWLRACAAHCLTPCAWSAAPSFAIAGLSLAALAAQLLLVSPKHLIFVDEFWYMEAGKNLLLHGGYAPGYFKAIGWPGLIAPVFAVFGFNNFNAIYLSVILGALSVPLGFYAAPPPAQRRQRRALCLRAVGLSAPAPYLGRHRRDHHAHGVFLYCFPPGCRFWRGDKPEGTPADLDGFPGLGALLAGAAPKLSCWCWCSPPRLWLQRADKTRWNSFS